MTTTRSKKLTKEKLAFSLLKAEGICPLEAAQLILELSRECKMKGRRSVKNHLERIRQSAKTGAKLIKKSEESVTFEEAMIFSWKQKKHRRKRTRNEILYMMKSLIRKFPELRKKKMRTITTENCRKYIEKGFKTPRQKYKARLVISGIFNTAIKQNWCVENPTKKIDPPVIKEQTIRILSPDDIERLLGTCEQDEHRSCLVPVALMLYAGIRPTEVQRVTWDDINLEEKVITLSPNHTKTGGTRHVSIMPPLEKILSSYYGSTRKSVCPKNWTVKWRDVRAAAGWVPKKREWQQDCLRHTFASYHAKYFRDYNLLQWEMGHRSSELLRTRYLNMAGVTQENAEQFWTGKKLVPIG